LKKGDKGDSVKAMQILLINQGFSCGDKGADGSYGSATEKALHEFKKSKKLKVTSTCGAQTWSALLGV
jgi:peptidoglycan hydrolase-like protein with peptidoglycan-binding domain